MINYLAILLLGIVGAYAHCNDGGRVSCYVNLYMNNEITDKKTLCDQLPLTQQCVNNTGCPMEELDNYLESLIKSCSTPCDLFKSIECSKKFNRPQKNMTFYLALEDIKKCYTTNKCEKIMNENPTFFKISDEAKDNVDKSDIWKSGRLGTILKKVKKTLKEKKEQPKEATTPEIPATTGLPTGN